MKELDPSKTNEWLYLEYDGELTSAEIAELDALAAASPEIASERQEISRLHALLQESKIEVRPEFKAEVLSALPAAGWGARHPRTWWVAALVLALLGSGAALLTGLSAAQLEPASPFVAAIAAIGDLFASSVTAGAGLIGASWRGIGLAVSEWLGGSIPNAIAFGVLVVGVNLLLLRRLRRRPRPAAAAEPARTDRSSVE
jgi:hypothetical protein